MLIIREVLACLPCHQRCTQKCNTSIVHVCVILFYMNIYILLNQARLVCFFLLDFGLINLVKGFGTFS